MTRLERRSKTERPTWIKLLAWGVHCYTALGLVAAAGMAVLLAGEHPSAAAFRWCFVLMLIATLIDSTDGMLARRIRIKEVLPGFDGRRLDDLTDFLTYTCLPLLLIWRAELLPQGQEWWLLAPLLASAYGFCQVSAKTADGYFLGFPSFWNVVAFYLYILHPPGWVALALILVLSFLTFVPSRYLYPSQPGRINRWTNVLGTLWVGLLAWILVTLRTDPPSSSTAGADFARQLTLVSLFFPLYYLGASWALSLWFAARGVDKRTHPPASGEAP